MAKNTATETVPAPVIRTSAGLRDLIFDEIDALRNGTSNAARANSMAKLASGIVETVHMELEVHKYARNVQKPEAEQSGFLGSPLTLGV